MPLHLFTILSYLIIFVGIAGIGHMISFPVTIWMMIILTLVSMFSLYPISNLREKYYLTNKLERKFEEPWIFTILGIVFIFLGIFLFLKVNPILGGSVTGFGIGGIIGGFLGIWGRKKLHQEK